MGFNNLFVRANQRLKLTEGALCGTDRFDSGERCTSIINVGSAQHRQYKLNGYVAAA